MLYYTEETKPEKPIFLDYELIKETDEEIKKESEDIVENLILLQSN